VECGAPFAFAVWTAVRIPLGSIFSVAAEEKLRALEDEISAFIRAKRRSGSDSLLPAPKQGWSGAGRHVWYVY
jgi:hypothetical protein